MSVYKSLSAHKQFNAHYDDVLSHWTVPYESHLVATDFGETHVLTFGALEKPPLLMLTGGNGIAAHWGLAANSLVERFRIYAPDIVGQPGRSDPRRPRSADESYACWLVALLDYFGLDTVHSLGLSFGGWLSLKLAACFPERVARLVLVAPAGIVPLRVGTLLRMLPHLILTRSGAEYFIDKVAAKPLDPYLKSSMLLIYQSLRPALPVKQPLFTDKQLAGMCHPTLLLVGEADILIPAERCVQRAARLMPHVTAEVVKEAGHILPSDQPELFAAKVIAHLEAL